MYADVSFPLDNVQRLLRGVKKSHIGVLSDNRPEMQKALRIAQMQIWPPKNSTNNTYCNLQKTYFQNTTWIIQITNGNFASVIQP